MPKLPLIGPYAQGRSPVANSHLCQNFMPKFDSDNGKERWYWVHSPGCGNPVATFSSAVNLMGMAAWNDNLYAATLEASDCRFYKYTISSGVASTALGTAAVSSYTTMLAPGNDQIAFVNRTEHIYVYDGTTFYDISKWAETLTVTDIAVDSGTTYLITVSDTLSPLNIANGDKVYIKSDLSGWTGEYTVASLNETAKTFKITQTGSADIGSSLTATSAYVLHQSFTEYFSEITITSIISYLAGYYDVNCSTDLTTSNIEAGDTVHIRGTTNFNTAYVVGSVNHAGNSFTINEPSAPADETGTFQGYTVKTTTGIKPSHIVYMDSYFIINNTVTNTVTDINNNDFYVSYPGDARIWVSSNSGSAQRFSDPLLAMYASGGDLYLFGQQNLEIFYNSGEGTQPFVSQRNLALPWGICAPYSIAEVDGSVYWVASQSSGGRSVVRAHDYTVERVSTPAIEYLLDKNSDAISFTHGWAYSYYGDSCYAISNNIATGSTGFHTLIYDATTSGRGGASAWSQLSPTALGAASSVKFGVGTKTLNSLGLSRAPVFYSGDFSGGSIRTLSVATYTWGTGTAGSAAITRTGISGAIHLDDKSLFFKRVFVDMENPAGTGYIDLSWSDDNGASYGSARSKLFTTANTRAEYFGLGRSRTSRNFKIQTTAALPITILGAYADLEEGIY